MLKKYCHIEEDGRRYMMSYGKRYYLKGGKPLDDSKVQSAIAEGEAMLAGRGRLVIRPSGTEPLIRVMAEGDDAGQVERVVDMICDAVRMATQ